MPMHRLLGACAPAALALGCVRAADETHIVDAEGIEAIVVTLDNGDVTITGDPDATEIRVDAEMGGIGFGEIGVYGEQGILFVDYRCDGPSLCGGDIAILTPAYLHVDTALDAGDVDLGGLEGCARATVGAGDIRVREHRGSDLQCATGAGAVTAELLTRPDLLVADVAAGSIDLTVPAGGYRLQIDVGTGDLRMDGVVEDPDAASLIDARTGTGSIAVIGW